MTRHRGKQSPPKHSPDLLPFVRERRFSDQSKRRQHLQGFGLTPTFLRGSGFLDGLCIRDSACFGKSFSRAGFLSEWVAGSRCFL